MNIFDDALKKVKEVAKIINEDVKFLENPERVIITSFPVKIKGETHYLTGYRVQYNSLLGPYKGGLRFAPSVDIDEVKALALWMTIKNSLAGIPYGGGKGGVTIDTNSLSQSELESVTRAFTRSIVQFIGSRVDVPAPDMYTNQQVMAWLLDEYESIKGFHEPGVVTGKPVILGGSEGREKSTALGAFYIIKNVTGKGRVAIQGFGNVGLNIALILYKAGYKVIAVSDINSGIKSKEGINIPELVNYKNKTGSVKGFQLTEDISNKELLELETDILIPAAVENVINKDNAFNIKAKMIFEIANGPITSEADEVLEKKDIMVYPDVLCNAGGVIVSYYEWVQNNQGLIWSEDEVNKKLESKMMSNLNNIETQAKLLKVSLRKGAYALALKRLVESKNLRSH